MKKWCFPLFIFISLLISSVARSTPSVEEIDRMIATLGKPMTAVEKRQLAVQLEEIFADETKGVAERRGAVLLAAKLRLVGIVPSLVRHIDSLAYPVVGFESAAEAFPCVYALSMMGGAALDATLEALLEEQNLQRRILLFQVLANIKGGREALAIVEHQDPKIGSAIRSDERFDSRREISVSSAARSEWAGINEENAESFADKLNYLIGAPSLPMSVRVEAAEIVGEFRIKRATPGLIRNIGKVEVRGKPSGSQIEAMYPCVKALLWLGEPAADEVLTALVKEKDNLSSALLVYCLMKIRGERTLKQIEAADPLLAAKIRTDKVYRKVLRLARPQEK